MSSNKDQDVASVGDRSTNAKLIMMRQSLIDTELELVKTLPPLPPTLEEFRSTAPSADGKTTIPLKIVRPKLHKDSHHPLILLFHGGGFSAGTPEMLTRPAREFAEELDAVVVLASYRLAPEHPFPAPMLDGFSIAGWVLDHSFGADPSRGFVVGGHSAGGQLAAIICSQARFHPLQHPITGCFMAIPSMVHRSVVPDRYLPLWNSRTENATPETAENDVDVLHDLLQADLTSPWFSPFNSTSLSKLPPTYIQAGYLDIWRDDGIIYAKALEDSGVPVRIDVLPKMAHGAFTVWAQGEGDHNPPELKPTTMSGMSWLLQMGSKD